MPIKVSNGIYLNNLLFSRQIIHLTNFRISKPKNNLSVNYINNMMTNKYRLFHYIRSYFVQFNYFIYFLCYIVYNKCKVLKFYKK